MKLSTECYSLRKELGEKGALRAIAEAGFDCVDYSFYWLEEPDKTDILGAGYKQHALETRAFLDEIGLQCNQAHAPFEFSLDKNTCDESDEKFVELLRSMEAAAILGAESIIVHSVKPLPGQTALEANLRFYGSLAPYAERFGIRIAIENLFGGPRDERTGRLLGNRFDRPESMMELVHALNSAVFVVCIDIGHATVTGIAPQDYIRAMDKTLLRALHVQDNLLCSDDHFLPYMGRIDWEAVTGALHEMGYEGDMTLEVFRFLDKFPKSVLPEALKLAAAVGRDLMRRIEAK